MHLHRREPVCGICGRDPLEHDGDCRTNPRINDGGRFWPCWACGEMHGPNDDCPDLEAAA